MNDFPIEIYRNEQEIYTNEYICSLHDQNDIYISTVFTGLIKYIKNHLKFYEDIKLLSDVDFFADVWELYTDLCYRYRQNPTESEFIIYINISVNIYSDMKNGRYRKDDRSLRFNISRPELLENIRQECALARYKQAEKGNPGGIFLSKAIDGLREDSGQIARVKAVSIGLDSIAALIADKSDNDNQNAISFVQNDEPKNG